MPRQPRSVVSTLHEHLRTIANPTKSVNEVKFQKIMDCVNARNPEPEQALSGVKLYVWRTFPRIDAAKTGRKTTNVLMIDCVNVNEGNTTVTPLPSNIREFLGQQLGGGRYRLSLNDKTQEATDGKGQTDVLCQTAIKIDHTEVAPILDPREIDETDPETAQWVVRQLALNALVRNAQGGLQSPSDRSFMPAAARADSAANGDAGLAAVAMEAIKQRADSTSEHAMRANIEMVSETAKRMIDQARAGQAGPELLISLAQVLKGDSGGGVAVMIPLLQTMMQEQSKMQMQFMTLMLQHREPPPQDTGTGINVVEKLLELADRQKGGGWMDTLKEMMPMVLPLLLARGLGGNAPAQPDLTGLANMMAQARNGNGAPAGDPAAGGVPITAQLIQNFAARAWTCMSRQQDGTDLANAIEVMFSPAHYDALYGLGKDQLKAQLLSTQYTQNFQNAGPAFDKFLEEFISYGEQPDEASPPGGAPATTPIKTTAPPPGAV
jgi:hypothetical protein